MQWLTKRVLADRRDESKRHRHCLEQLQKYLLNEWIRMVASEVWVFILHTVHAKALHGKC